MSPRSAECLVNAAMALLLVPAIFILLNWLFGERPLFTEFEQGAVTGIVAFNLVGAARFWGRL